MPTKRTSLQERYELGEVLGRGGMGIVYKAYDTLMRRHVALKTILELDNAESIQLFYKEWSLLATLVHPNVISIYDIGEFSQGGVKKPFFVMPLLPGATLDKLIGENSPSLTVAGVLGIIGQACRGLHAAHEQGLVHRDIKPSNIFVMDDHSVKIIDFGIARDASAASRTTMRGTLHYMAPEQFSSKPASPLSDLFALGVVTYEALTRRRPFQGASDSEIIVALEKRNPQPVSELNPDAGYSLSQVVNKALAKQPLSRFSSVREFGEALEKAMRGEPLDYFSTARIKPRLDRAVKSFEQGDYGFASEVLFELEAEGQLNPEISTLRVRLDNAMRQSHVQQLLDSARRFFEASEYPLASRKIQEAIELDPANAVALSLKAQLETQRQEEKFGEWMALARQHVENGDFQHAGVALDNAIKLKPGETQALNLLADVKRREQEASHAREENERLYQAARQALERGETTSALSQIEALIATEPGAGSDEYRKFYHQVRSERDTSKAAYEESRRNLSSGNFEAALAICRQYLAKYPNDALFKALQSEVEDRRRQDRPAEIAGTGLRVEQEPDLDKRVAILEDALARNPGESHFERALQSAREKRDRVSSILAKVRFFEERGQLNEALEQCQVLRSIHPQQPGLTSEIERLTKARWVHQAGAQVTTGDFDGATKTVQDALAEFPGDAELLRLEKQVRNDRERAARVGALLNQARGLQAGGDLPGALAVVSRGLASFPAEPRLQQLQTTLEKALNPPPPPPPPVSPKRNRLVYGAAAAGVAALVVFAGVAYRRSHATPALPAPVAMSKVNLRSSPPGAAITVDGKPCGASACELQLPAGNHQAEASLDGYQLAKSAFQVQAGGATPLEINLTLLPSPEPSLLPVVTISTDLTEAAVSIDNTQAGKIQGGQIELSSLPQGPHNLSLQGGAFQASVQIDIAPGVIPKVLGPIKTSGLQAFLVARGGAEARIYSSVEGSQASVDGKPAGAIGPQGLEVAALAPGTHEIMIDAPGGTHRKIAFDSGPSNHLLASFVTGRQVGVLRILVDDGATAYLNGEKYRRTATGGRLMVSLAPKQYTVRVEKEGFASPPEQVVTLKNGEEAKVEFKLLPARASLSVRNAAPGTEIWIDGARIGTVRPDGTFLSDVDPGKHVVALRSEHYKPIQSERVFAAGKPLELDGKLEAALGMLKIEVNPPGKGTRLRLRRQGAAQDREITETSLNLPEGAYTVTTSTPQYQDGSATVQVAANRTVTASLILKPIEAPKQRSFTLPDWEKTGGWMRDGSSLTHRGGDFVLAPENFGPGTIVFSVRSIRGKRLEWVLDFRDLKNYCLFQLDDKNFSHSEVVNGKRTDGLKIPHGASRKDFIGIAVTATARTIQHRILRAGQWLVLDSWERPGVSPQGSFGFHIPGRDEIALSDFRFAPQ